MLIIRFAQWGVKPPFYTDSLGHPSFDPRCTRFEGSVDEALLAEACRLDAVFLTTDRDFFTRYTMNSPVMLAS